MALSKDQLLLLTKIGQYTAANRRTDRLAVCMAHCDRQYGGKWDLNHIPFIGLQLRAAGFVTTHKDTQQYALWEITNTGRAKLLEEAALARKVAEAAVPQAAEPAKSRITEFMVVGESDGEISTVQKTLKDAEALAEKWAREEPGCAYRVLGVFSVVKANITIEKV